MLKKEGRFISTVVDMSIKERSIRRKKNCNGKNSVVYITVRSCIISMNVPKISVYPADKELISYLLICERLWFRGRMYVLCAKKSWLQSLTIPVNQLLIFITLLISVPVKFTIYM